MLRIVSTAFRHEGEIPTKHTCEGNDVSPALQWSSVPEGTQSLALVVDDPDAPDPKAPKMTWVHWVLFNLPPESSGLQEGVASEALPAGTCEGLNDWKRMGWGGPCPPDKEHRYFFKLFALDTELDLPVEAGKPALLNAMEGHILAKAELVGVYDRKSRRG